MKQISYSDILREMYASQDLNSLVYGQNPFLAMLEIWSVVRGGIRFHKLKTITLENTDV